MEEILKYAAETGSGAMINKYIYQVSERLVQAFSSRREVNIISLLIKKIGL
jgi:hypothetical protein